MFEELDKEFLILKDMQEPWANLYLLYLDITRPNLLHYNWSSPEFQEIKKTSPQNITYKEFKKLPLVKNYINKIKKRDAPYWRNFYKNIVPKFHATWAEYKWPRHKAYDMYLGYYGEYRDTPASKFIEDWRKKTSRGEAPDVNVEPRYWSIEGLEKNIPKSPEEVATYDRIWKVPFGSRFPNIKKIHCLYCLHMTDSPVSCFCKKYESPQKKPDSVYFDNALCDKFTRAFDHMITKRVKYAIFDKPFSPRPDVEPPPNWEEANEKHLLMPSFAEYIMVDYGNIAKQKRLSKQAIQALTDSINRVEMPQHLVFFRGGFTKELQRILRWDSVIFEDIVDAFRLRFAHRIEFIAENFTSCVTHPETEGCKKALVLFKILVPKYAHALYMEPIKEADSFNDSAHPSGELPPEPEIILPPQSRFRIVDFSNDGNQFIITVALIDDGDHAWENGQAIGRLVDGKLYYSRSAAKAAMDKLNQSKAEN